MNKLIFIVLFTACYADNSADKDRNATQLIASRGFQSKTYTVETSDGYIVTMFRIINPFRSGRAKSSVLVQHGVMGNSEYWMLNTPGLLNSSSGLYTEESGVVTDCSSLNESAVGNTIPFVLSACGYDVWLGNNRGTLYSLGHINLDYKTDKQFWKFSVDDIQNDIVAMVNFIKNHTQSKTIGYIGHSLGTTQMFQLLTENAEMNKVIRPFIALAPVAYVDHIGPLLKVSSLMMKIPLIENLNEPIFGLTPDKFHIVNKNILSNVCSAPIADTLCESFVFLFGGFNYIDSDTRDYPARMSHVPDETSFKVIAHLAYRANTGTFAKWDHRLTNVAHYGKLTPPIYDLSKITSTNMVFISGQNDLLGDQSDIDRMRSELKVKPYDDYIVPNARWNHFDFIWATNAGKLVNSKILSYLDQSN